MPQLGRLNVVFVELTVYQGTMPLASGYMQAYATQDPLVAGRCSFQKVSVIGETPHEELITDLRRRDAQVYAFSCYLWNIGLVRRLVADLRETHPDAYVILGGPQVMNCGDKYLGATDERLVLCNGEGEKTFHRFLQQVLTEAPDFAEVKGLSFYRDGELITTEPEERIRSLDEIPSPFLAGLFDHEGPYVWAIIETNRGCPFKCSYCYWGAATGAKVNYFEEDRVREELEWLSRYGVFYVFIADANWGIRRRDIELSAHLADAKRQHGAPKTIYFCGSKNNPDRVAEITEIFHGAGMVTTQSIALQTMSQDTLANVGRANIKTATYTDLQRRLNERGISSFVEMIWPLPGETLQSFKEGMGELCALGADSYIIYPLLLMNNVELTSKRDEFCLETIPDPDPNSEGELVISTKWVSPDDYNEGVRFGYSLTNLYSMRGLWCLADYLHETGRMTYHELFAAFAAHWREHPDNPFSNFCETAIQSSEQYKFQAWGAMIHLSLHAERAAFDRLLGSFVARHDWWADPVARGLFEVDLLNRPYVYSNTQIEPKDWKFEQLEVLETTAHGYLVELPADLRPRLERRITLEGDGESNLFQLDHRREQLPYMPSKSLKQNYAYCQDTLHKMRSLLPIWAEQMELVV
ncbi:MAG: radical SAM protein [Planctomycetota bacterium]